MGDNWPKHVTVAGMLVRKDEGAVGDETIDVVGASSEAELQLIELPLYLCRIRQMQAYDSRVFYQSYTNPPYLVHAEQ